MNLLAVSGIFLGIILMIFLSSKGVNVILSATAASVVIILTNRMPLQEALLTGNNSYMAGLGKYVMSYLPIFILGSILGKCLEDGRATITIASTIFKITGKDDPFKALVAIAAIAALLTYGGISVFIVIFTIVGLARPIFKELDLPWRLVMVPLFIGGNTFTMVMLPGTPSIQNVIPTELGTALTAAPLLSIIVSVITIIFCLIYMKWELKRAIASGEHYEGPEIVDNHGDNEKRPSLLISLTPITALIIIILVGSKMNIPNIVIPALVAADVLAIVLLHKYIPDTRRTLNTGVINSSNPMLFIAAAVGTGKVIIASPGFAVIQKALNHVPGGAMVQIIVITGFLSMASASSSGTLGIVIPSFGAAWIANGVNAQLVHRLAAMASGTFSCMPHSGFIFSSMEVLGIKHKDAYRPIFFAGFILGIFTLIIAVILGAILY